MRLDKESKSRFFGGGGGGTEGGDWRQEAGVGEGAKQKCKITYESHHKHIVVVYNLYFQAKDHF